jgi:Fic family protein
VDPPFSLTPSVISACSRIERLVGVSEGLGGATPEPQLRRSNLVRTVQATAAIEGNTLSLDQVTAVLEGRHVRGPRLEIREIRNAVAAYELVPQLDPHQARDFLRAHGVLMAGLVEDAGRYRRGNVGVLSGTRVAHVAPPAKRVPLLMANLFTFITKNDAPPLIKACVFHYEVEFIHPFSDGNGRIGRLWQHALLCAHSAVFAHVPAESLIKVRQGAYYAALSRSDKAGDATPFISFMLAVLEDSVTEFVAGFRPARADAATRLATAAAYFGVESFSRKDYLALHKDIAQATASRDLRVGVDQGKLSIQGDKATARYVFVGRRRGGRVSST